jgi:hypothetical protein
MAADENVSAEDFRQILTEVEGEKPTQLLMALSTPSKTIPAPLVVPQFVDLPGEDLRLVECWLEILGL